MLIDREQNRRSAFRERNLVETRALFAESYYQINSKSARTNDDNKVYKCFRCNSPFHRYVQCHYPSTHPGMIRLKKKCAVGGEAHEKKSRKIAGKRKLKDYF